MLRLEKISKTFNPGTVNAKKALDELDFHVKKGDFITIIGSNGAGKTTLFNAVSGRFITDSGRVILNGEDVTLVTEHVRAKKIGRLFQEPKLGSAPGMTIEENLTLAAGEGGWLGRINQKERDFFREKLSELNMGLENRMNDLVGLLSGGQRQALTLVMATINPPELLLLDEHTAALDPESADKVLSLTESIVKEGEITCLMITHNMESALQLGNRTIMMNAGRIIYDVEGQDRDRLQVSDLLDKFKEASGKALDNDRMLL